IIHNEVNKIPTAKLIIIDGSASEESFTASNDTLFIPGKAIDIAVGYLRSEVSSLFIGTVIKHNIKIRSNGASVLIVECKADTFKMTLSKKGKFYENTTDSNVIEDILATY